MLSDDQLAEFGRRGVVRLPGVITADVAGMIEDRIWEFLDERAGAVRDDPSTWPDTIGKLQPLRKAAVFDPFLDDRLDAITDQLLGPGWIGDLTRP